MLKHKEQRVGVFVDVSNMYYSARHIYKRKVNFKEILKAAVAGRKLIRAISYVIKAETESEQGFFDALSNAGFEVKMKDLQVFWGGQKKGDWDVGITVDMIKMGPKLDVMVLISGDGDFQPLLEYLKSLGHRTEIIAFGKSASKKLIEEADDFIDLDKEAKKYLI
ncbi:MAG: NYN domain-containing protein [Patescibacteria group bacterium]|nr:NYN domain-containing protein [Patescibacteria group bacterium]